MKSRLWDVALFMLASPVLAVVAIAKAMRHSSLARKAAAATIPCGTCGSEIVLVDFWRCRCGYTSYAWNVKIHNLQLEPETRMRAYEFLDVREAYDEIRDLIEAFERRHDWAWQAGFNGRSGGYLVLYRGGRRDPGWKTRCDQCGKLTWYETEQPCYASGCGGTLELLAKPVYQTFVYPGKGVDEDEDFSEWSIEDLEARVRLVRDFDKLAHDCIRSFINFVTTHRVEEREMLVPKTVRVAVQNS